MCFVRKEAYVCSWPYLQVLISAWDIVRNLVNIYLVNLLKIVKMKIRKIPEGSKCCAGNLNNDIGAA